MHTPKISIITPVWNGLPFLKMCITSVLTQEFEDWELLVSDDGSTDGSAEYLNSLTDRRIRVFRQEQNLGIFGNLNFLFAQAKAPFSQILCQDDYFTGTSSLSAIMRYWAGASSKIGFVRFNHLEEPSECLTINLQQQLTPAVVSPEHADLWFFIFGNIPGNLSNVSLRTSIVNELGGFDQGMPFAGDFEFWSRAARRFHMGVEDANVVFVRRHANVASNFLSRKGELYTQHLMIYEKLIDDLSHLHCRKKLIKYFNFEIGSFHYRTGIRSALNGSFSYLKQFIRAESAISWPLWQRLTACFPLAMYEKGRLRITVRMARKFLETSNLILILSL